MKHNKEDLIHSLTRTLIVTLSVLSQLTSHRRHSLVTQLGGRCKGVIGHLQQVSSTGAIRSESGRLVQVVQIAQQAFLLVADQVQQGPVVVRMLRVTIEGVVVVGGSGRGIRLLPAAPVSHVDRRGRVACLAPPPGPLVGAVSDQQLAALGVRIPVRVQYPTAAR